MPLRGESLDLLACETGRAGGRSSSPLAVRASARPAPVEDVALREAQRKVGELSIKVDILRPCWRRMAALRRREALEESDRRDRRMDRGGLLRGVRDDRPRQRRNVGQCRAADGPLRRRPAQGGVWRALRLDRSRRRLGLGAALRRWALLSLRALPSRNRSPRHRRLPTFHYEPKTNGCAEKFIQTLKEQALWIESFEGG